MKRSVLMTTLLNSGGESLPAWLTAGGLSPSDWVVAHDALAASSLANSYINLVNPGTNDLTAGAAAPTWDAVNGWTFNGSTQYLVTVPILTTYSIFVQYTDLPVADGYLLGLYDDESKEAITSSATAMLTWRGESYASNAPHFPAGILIISGLTTYRDGVADANLAPGGGTNANIPAFLGCVNYPPGGGAFSFIASKIQRFGLLNRELTQPEITALVAALTP